MVVRMHISIPPAAASPANSGRARSDGLGHYSGRLRTGGSKDNALETQTPGTLAAATPGAAVDVASRASYVDTRAASRVRLQAWSQRLRHSPDRKSTRLNSSH